MQDNYNTNHELWIKIFFGGGKTCYNLFFNCGFELSFGGHFGGGGLSRAGESG